MIRYRALFAGPGNCAYCFRVPVQAQVALFVSSKAPGLRPAPHRTRREYHLVDEFRVCSWQFAFTGLSWPEVLSAQTVHHSKPEPLKRKPTLT